MKLRLIPKLLKELNLLLGPVEPALTHNVQVVVGTLIHAQEYGVNLSDENVRGRIMENMDRVIKLHRLDMSDTRIELRIWPVR